MIPPANAFALAFQPSFVATLLASRELLDLLALETGAPELADAIAFARKTLRIAEGEAREAEATVAKLAAKLGLPKLNAPKNLEEQRRWHDEIVAAARGLAGEDAIAVAAIDAGVAAGRVNTAIWVARNAIYLRAAAPEHEVLRQEARRRADELAAGLRELRAVLARRPLPQYVLAMSGKLEERLQTVPDIQAAADADALKAFFDWAHKLSLVFLELGPAFAGPVEGAVAAASEEERALLAEILARPDDEAPRLRYAELAARRNDPRADFIMASLSLSALRARGPIDAQQVRVTGNAAQILAAHPEWSRDVLALGAEAVKFHRGFVEEISIKAATFLEKAADLYRIAPILHVRMKDAAGLGAALAASPHLERLRSLSFEANWIGDDDIIALAASPHVAGLRYLDLTRNKLTQRGVEAIAASPYLKSLVYCSVMFNDCDDPVDKREHVNETQFVWEPTEAGKRLEEKFGPIRWLHPGTQGAWPPSFDQI